MAKLYVTEYVSTGDIVGQGNIAAEPEVATQVVTYTGTAAASTAFGTATRIIRLHTDSICSVFFSVAGTDATTSNRRMVAGQTEYFKVPGGQSYKVSAIVNT